MYMIYFHYFLKMKPAQTAKIPFLQHKLLILISLFFYDQSRRTNKKPLFRNDDLKSLFSGEKYEK